MQVERILPGHRGHRVLLPARDRRGAAPAGARDHPGLRGGSERLMARRSSARLWAKLEARRCRERDPVSTWCAGLPLAGRRAPDLSRFSAADRHWYARFRQWARSPTATVVAPFAFEVRKSSEEIAREGESRALTRAAGLPLQPHRLRLLLGAARDILRRAGARRERRPRAAVRAVAATRVRLGPEETAYLADSSAVGVGSRSWCTHFLAEALSRGVADAGVMRGEASPSIALRRGETERVVPRDSILTFADLMEQAEAAGDQPRRPGRAAHAPPPGRRVLPADHRARSARSPPRAGSSSARAWIR